MWSLLHFFFDTVSLVFYGYVLVFAHVALLVAVVFPFFSLFLAAIVDALTTPSSLYIIFFFFLENHSYFPSLFSPKEKKDGMELQIFYSKKKGTHQHALKRGIRSVCRRVQSRCSANVAISHAIMGSSPVVTAATLDCLVCVRREEVAGSKHGRVEGRRLCGARGSKVGLRG